MDLLSQILPKLNRSLPASMISSKATDIVKNHPTSLQVSLGVLCRDSKDLINHLHAFHITCSYDEILRFKKSAAVATKEDINMEAIKHADNGMIQVIVDNFDVDISSQNWCWSSSDATARVQQCSVEQGDASAKVETFVAQYSVLVKMINVVMFKTILVNISINIKFCFRILVHE